MSLELVLLVSHVPSILHESKAPVFQKEIIAALHTQKEHINEVKADVIVIISCHFKTNWNHYVDATPKHEGICTAMEHPDLIANLPYSYPGDEMLAIAIAEAGKEAGIPAVSFNESSYVWDYGTLIPIRYLVPDEDDIAVIELSVNESASLEETFRWGQAIGKALRKSDKRVVFVGSGALSHRLIRGREAMPSLAEQALDDRFVEYLMNGRYDLALAMLPQYSEFADVESGGRHVAAMLGVLRNDTFKADYLGYAQSSGSGNHHISFHAKRLITEKEAQTVGQ